MNWYLYFIGVMSLGTSVFLTIALPGVLWIVYLIGTTKEHKLLVGKIVYIGLFGIVLSAVIWLVFSFIFVALPIASTISLSMKHNIEFIFIIPALVISIIICYVAGKRKNWIVPIMKI